MHATWVGPMEPAYKQKKLDFVFVCFFFVVLFFVFVFIQFGCSIYQVG
jgi:hypothetical protein